MAARRKTDELEAALAAIDALYMAGDLDALARISARAASHVRNLVYDLVQKGTVRP